MRGISSPFMIIIFGPTGVGKSAFAVELGQHIPAEIINADMGQLYTPLTIGTAKSAWRSETIPHHMFDLVDEPRNYTVNEYRTTIDPLLHETWQRGNIPIIVGGSGFYLHSLLFPPQAGPTIDEDTIPADWNLLHRIDSVRAQNIHPNDAYRIKRALSIWFATGIAPSDWKRPYQPPAPYVLIQLTRDRAQLYEQINTRTITMLDEGWLDECRLLYGTEWEPFVRKKKLIGYGELFDYVAGNLAYDEVIATIAQKTRNYAKRQETFGSFLSRTIRRAMPSENRFLGTMQQVNLTSTEPRLYINQLLKNIDAVKA